MRERGIGWAELAFAAAVYAAAVLYAVWPLPLRLEDGLILSTDGIVSWNRLDVDLVAWILGWGAHALATDPAALFQANIFYPAPNTLASSEHLLGLQVFAAPIFWASGNAVLAYNVTVLATSWLAAMTMFFAARHWTGSAVAGFVAGAAFAFSPGIAREFSRLNESPLYLFPVVALLAWKAAEAPTMRLLVGLVLATSLQALTGMYIAYELALVVLAITPGVLLHARANRRTGIAPLAAMGIGLATLIPFSLPYLRAKSIGAIPAGDATDHGIAVLSTSVAANVLRLVDLLTWPIALMALLGLFWGPARTRSLRIGLGLVLGLGVLIAAGTHSPGVFQFFRAVVPGFENVRLPARFLVISLFAGALAGGLGVGVLLEHLRARGSSSARVAAAVVSIAALALLIRVPTSPPKLRDMPRSPVDWAVYDFLSESEGAGAVLELPIFGSPFDAGTAVATGQYMIGSTRHWRPILNGYSGYFPGSHEIASVLGRGLPDARAFRDLCDFFDIDWIVVHGDRMPRRAQLFLDSGLPIEPAVRFGRDAVYRVSAECGALQERMLEGLAGTRPGRTLRDLPQKELPVEAREGRISPALPPAFLAGVHRYVPALVTNTSDVPWPGLSTSPTHRVAVESRWIPVDGGPPIDGGGPVPLMTDLGPGQSVKVWVSAYPPQPGDYTLEIGLLQVGTGWFADTGGEGLFRENVVVQPWRM